jgi:excinuclease ABC subunit A
MSDFIEIKGARLHNLKNIHVHIPRGKLVVITGPSGSGKSSLAFDTLYAEGQRRYVESLSAYARQFLDKMPKPEVDFISGIQPAIAIQQKAPSGNPRSTVGTVTEIYDYLRLLFARIGVIHCHNCGTRVAKDLSENVLHSITNLPLKSKFYIGFPLHYHAGDETNNLQEVILSRGFLRIWQNGEVIDLRETRIKNYHKHSCIIVDRQIRNRAMDRSRLIDSIETAFSEGEGNLWLVSEKVDVQKFSQNYLCKNCGTIMVEPQPRLFSFNNPFGACPGCQGFGDMTDLDFNKIIPDPTKSIRQGAIQPWNSSSHQRILTRLSSIAPEFGISLEKPFQDLTENQKDVIINGTRNFPGIRGFFKKLERKKYKVHVRVFLSRYRSYFKCTICHGKRLRPEALAITLSKQNISDLVKKNINQIDLFFKQLKLSQSQYDIAQQLLKEIQSRLQYLKDMGLDYLQLDRRANTLSGGEFQRINLATALGAALTGTLYILDEPTIGLHPRDTRRLINILKSLSSMGNTTVVVEHEREMIKNTDYIVDLGPASGEAGGELMFEGSLAKFKKYHESLTAQYFHDLKSIPNKKKYRKGNGLYLNIRGAREHNLKNLAIQFPLGKMIAVTGVSGSGKSTLIHDLLFKGYLKAKGKAKDEPGKFDEIRGLQNIFQMELIDQSPIGRTPRSNPITYIKAFDEIRKLYASLTRSKASGFTPGHFSFNVPGGRCENCNGDGQLKIEMQFLADVYITCEVCNGKRFKKNVLGVYYQGENIINILDMTVDQALEFFSDRLSIIRKMTVLKEVGLGYLRLGQSATTLSGGEAQRIKLAAHLNRKTHRDVLFLFDEPTTGLHFDDISNLLQAFDVLIAEGASVIIIEHNLDVIKVADWIIDLGPEGGEAGGHVVAEGTPMEIANHPSSYTGHYLKKVL